METKRARLIAERLHAGEPDGAPLLAHIARVVSATPTEAQAIAWLHEALPRAAATEHELLADGLSSDELRALRLLAWPGWSHSDSAYLMRVQLIARAAGWSGRVARIVMAADLRDRREHSRSEAGAWAPPYGKTLRLLRSSHEDPSAVAAGVG